MPGRVLAARAGVIVGAAREHRAAAALAAGGCAEGGDVLAPGPPEATMQLIDARDLAAWMLDMAETAPRRRLQRERRSPGRRPGASCSRRSGRSPAARERCAGPMRRGSRSRSQEPWDELPLWPIPSLRGALRDVGLHARPRRGLAPRPLPRHVADTWAWLAVGGTLDGWRTRGARERAAPASPSAGCSAKIGIAPKPAADTRQRRSPSRSRVMLVRKGLRDAAYEGSRGRATSADGARRSRGGYPRRTSGRERRLHP